MFYIYKNIFIIGIQFFIIICFYDLCILVLKHMYIKI